MVYGNPRKQTRCCRKWRQLAIVLALAWLTISTHSSLCRSALKSRCKIRSGVLKSKMNGGRGARCLASMKKKTSRFVRFLCFLVDAHSPQITNYNHRRSESGIGKQVHSWVHLVSVPLKVLTGRFCLQLTLHDSARDTSSRYTVLSVLQLVQVRCGDDDTRLVSNTSEWSLEIWKNENIMKWCTITQLMWTMWRQEKKMGPFKLGPRSFDARFTCGSRVKTAGVVSVHWFVDTINQRRRGLPTREEKTVWSWHESTFVDGKTTARTNSNSNPTRATILYGSPVQKSRRNDWHSATNPFDFQHD